MQIIGQGIPDLKAVSIWVSLPSGWEFVILHDDHRKVLFAIVAFPFSGSPCYVTMHGRTRASEEEVPWRESHQAPGLPGGHMSLTEVVGGKKEGEKIGRSELPDGWQLHSGLVSHSQQITRGWEPRDAVRESRPVFLTIFHAKWPCNLE